MMSRNPDVPPAQTVRPMAPPPFTPRPTASQLQADIDSGRTGDKNELFDPAMAPLGTDDEAAGRPPEPERVAMARRAESVERWAHGGREGYAHHRGGGGALYGFIALIVVIAVLFAGLMWLR
jgi:hypothetical protein